MHAAVSNNSLQRTTPAPLSGIAACNPSNGLVQVNVKSVIMVLRPSACKRQAFARLGVAAELGRSTPANDELQLTDKRRII